MSHNTIREAVMARVRDGLVPMLAEIEMPVEYENKPFKKTKKAYARFIMATGKTTPVAIGAMMNRTPVVLYLMVFMPEDDGTKAAWDAADMMALTFDYCQLRPNRSCNAAFQTTSPPATVRTVDGFHQMNVTIVGYYDIRPSLLLADTDGALLTDTDRMILT